MIYLIIILVWMLISAVGVELAMRYGDYSPSGKSQIQYLYPSYVVLKIRFFIWRYLKFCFWAVTNVFLNGVDLVWICTQPFIVIFLGPIYFWYVDKVIKLAHRDI